MNKSHTIEAISIYWPLFLCATLLWLLRSSNRDEVIKKRSYVGILMSSTWVAATLPWLNEFAVIQDYWRFEIEHNFQIISLPVSFYLGWIILWGVLPALLMALLEKVNFLSLTAFFILLDLCTMHLFEPVLELQPHWIIGESVLILGCLLPSFMLSKWVLNDRYPGRRATLISIAFILIVLTLLPSVHAVANFHPIETWRGFSLVEQMSVALILGFITVAGISAVQEFAVVGKGTPIPQDPPKHLVTSGIYSYIKNPIQLSLVLVLTLWSVLFSYYLFIAVAISVIYCVGIARWSENIDLSNKYEDRWKRYRINVPAWFPTLLPHWDNASQKAEIYVDFQCGVCTSIANWIERKHPTALIIKDANNSEQALKRITYKDPNSGCTWSGVCAVGRVLQHINIGYAWLGWCICLPILSAIIQCAMDAAGGAPQKTT